MTDIEVVIINVLQQLLQKNEILSSESQPVVDLLRQEWINTSADLQVVLQDESSWQAIQLPVRLKLALQKYITSTNQTETTPNGTIEATNTNTDTEITESESIASPWRRDWDDEKKYWYYWNEETHESYWDTSEELNNDNNVEYENNDNITEYDAAESTEYSEYNEYTNETEYNNSTSYENEQYSETKESISTKPMESTPNTDGDADLSRLLQAQFDREAAATTESSRTPAHTPAHTPVMQSIPIPPFTNSSIAPSAPFIKTLPMDDPYGDPNDELYPSFVPPPTSSFTSTSSSNTCKTSIRSTMATTNATPSISATTSKTNHLDPCVPSIPSFNRLPLPEAVAAIEITKTSDSTDTSSFSSSSSSSSFVPMVVTSPYTETINQMDTNHTVEMHTTATPIMMLSGMLYKKSRKHALIGAKWQQRWFEVTHDSLNYYRTTEEETAQSPSSSPSSSSSSPTTYNSTPQKIKRLKVGMNVSVQWESVWLPAQIIKVQSLASKCDVIIVNSLASKQVGMANKWLKSVHRNQLRTRDIGSSNSSNSSSTTTTTMSDKNGYLGMVVGNSDTKRSRVISSPTPSDTSILSVSSASSISSSATSAGVESSNTHLHGLHNGLAVLTSNHGDSAVVDNKKESSSSSFSPASVSLKSSLPSSSASPTITTMSSPTTPMLRGKSILKSIPLTSIVAVIRESSSNQPSEFAVALKKGRVLELRAPNVEEANRWTLQLDAKVRSASLDQDEIPLPPMRSTHTIKESILKTSTSESTKTDGELARELQAQFDLEVRTSNDKNKSKNNNDNNNDAGLLWRLSQAGSSPLSSNR